MFFWSTTTLFLVSSYYIYLYFKTTFRFLRCILQKFNWNSARENFRLSIAFNSLCGDVLLCKKIFLREHLLPKKGFSHSFFFLPIQFIYFAGVSLKNVVHTPSFEHLKMLSDILCSKAKILGQTRQGATREILHKMPLPSYIHITISLFVFNENVKGNAS